jgi:hypothetical protein
MRQLMMCMIDEEMIPHEDEHRNEFRTTHTAK